MSLTSAKGRFQAYLLSPIEHYPVSKMPLSLKPTQDRRKELIFQQKLFLQVAEEYHETVAHLFRNDEALSCDQRQSG